jgi:hypothetical protein
VHSFKWCGISMMTSHCTQTWFFCTHPVSWKIQYHPFVFVLSFISDCLLVFNVSWKVTRKINARLKAAEYLRISTNQSQLFALVCKSYVQTYEVIMLPKFLWLEFNVWLRFLRNAPHKMLKGLHPCAIFMVNFFGMFLKVLQYSCQ